MAGTGRRAPGPVASRLRPVHAVGVLFVANGMSLPPLLPRFPQVKDAVGATEATFGLALLGTGIGGILGASAAPAVVRLVGSRRAAGFLVVPVLVGTLAEVVGLPLAFALMPLAGVAAAVLLPAALRRGAPDHL